MERRDDDFANDISVQQDGDEEEVKQGNDWHTSFQANYDRVSFANRHGINRSSHAASDPPQIEVYQPDDKAIVRDLKKSNLSLMRSVANQDSK